jgi:hypothetical protein
VVTVGVVTLGVVTTGVVTGGTVTDGTVAVGSVGTGTGTWTGAVVVAPRTRCTTPCRAGCCAAAGAVELSLVGTGVVGGVMPTWSSAFARLADGTSTGRLGAACPRDAGRASARRLL